MNASKTEMIKHYLSSGDMVKAISIASKFFDGSKDTSAFKQAHSAINNPGFYRQIGKDPDQIVSDAVCILKDRFLNVQSKPTARTNRANKI